MQKIGRALDFFMAWRFRKTDRACPVPLEVSVETTNVCNFKCSFCPQCSTHHFDTVGRNSLSVENARIILQKIRDFGYDRSRIHWTLDGEPFVNAHFAEISRVALQYGFTNQHFATNLMLFTPERAATLPHGVHYTLTVDFCADENYFETFRGTPGSWRKIHDNIQYIVTHPEYKQIHFSITDISTYKIQDRRILARNLQKMRQLFAPSQQIRFYSKTFNNSTGFVKKEFDTSRYHLCPYPWSSLVIASNGDVVACCRDLEHKSILGNVLQEGVSVGAVWNGEKFRRLRENLRNREPGKNGACRECDLPYDHLKYTLSNYFKTFINRLQFMR